jgi:sterol desaturase/sphingolipid hydroxylase (fatty acid hydroxylase superfamily)
MALICLSFGIAALLVCLERLWPARRDPTQNRINLLVWGVRLPLNLFVLPVIGAAIAELARRAGVPSLQVSAWPFALGAVAYLVVHDFGEFAFHRAQHAIPWLWRLHELHHSDPCMSATTTERHFWGDGVLKAVTIWPVAALLLQPSPGQYLFFSLCYLYNYFSHANLPVSYGRLSWVLNSPAYHRLHHSSEPEHFNRNFAALLPIWDVVIGAYRRPDGFPKTGLPVCPQTIADTLLWPLPSIRAPVPAGEAAEDGAGERRSEPEAA